MSKREVKERFRFNIIERIWWKCMPGTTITIPWPKKEWLTLHDDGDGGKTETVTDDPNYHYRSYLEKNVGKQGWDWDWMIDPKHSMYIMNVPREVNDQLKIKFRRGKESWASIIMILWT
jgi:hypothetical protein